MFLLLFIIIFHELAHLLVASFFGINASKINIYLFGGITKYDTDLNIRIYKEMLILLAGPISQLILMFIIYKIRIYIDIHTYTKFIEINKLLLMFNMLPIINLDGGKLFNLILNCFFSYKTSFKISIFISIICLPLILIFKVNLISIILVLFLIKNIIKEVKNHKYTFNKLLLERFLNKYNFKRKIIIKDINKFRKDYEHILIVDGKLMSEHTFLSNYFK